jgi:acyl-CoA thioesterase I
LQRALSARGFAVQIANAGITGDTAFGGLARVDDPVPPGTDAVILELGGNDGLRGNDPSSTKGALDQIIRRLKSRNIAVLLCGIKAPRHHSPEYIRGFDAMFPQLAANHNLLFYPFFLDGVVYHPVRAHIDGIHPTEVGIDYIVLRILPKVEQLIAQVKEKRVAASERTNTNRAQGLESREPRLVPESRSVPWATRPMNINADVPMNP